MSWLNQPEHFDADIIPIDRVPATLDNWVKLSDSMTARLAKHFGETPKVNVHYSGPAIATAWEQTHLAIAAETVFARQIALVLESGPILYARSITEYASPIEYLLSQLQTTPLAKVLFEDPNWSRAEEILPLFSKDKRYGRACIWQHKALNARLMVEEFFLF